MTSSTPLRESELLRTEQQFAKTILDRYQDRFPYYSIALEGAAPSPIKVALLRAVGDVGHELAARAARQVGVPLLAPGDDATDAQLLVAVFALLVVLGLVTELAIEGVEVGGADVGPAYILAGPSGYSDQEKASLAAEAGKQVQKIMGSAGDFAGDVFTLTKIYIASVEPAPLDSPVCFSDGTSADKLFGSLLQSLLSAVE